MLTKSLRTASTATLRTARPVPARSFHSSLVRKEYYPGVDAAAFKKQVTDKDGLVLVDFYATWCGPCKMLTPVLEKVTQNEGLDLVTLDVDIEQELAAKYVIRSLPTVVAFKDGEPLSQFMGAIPESGVKKFIESVKNA